MSNLKNLSFVELVQQANRLLESQKFDEAIELCLQAIELNPTAIELYYQLGDIYFKQQNWNKAQQYFQKAIEQQPNFSWAYYGLAKVAAEQQQWKKAAELFQSAMALSPHFSGDTQPHLDVEQFGKLAVGNNTEFDWEIYTQCNFGTEHLENYQAAYEHWLKGGREKNFIATEEQFYQLHGFQRSDLPVNFDWQIYLQLNPDVATEVQQRKWLAIRHFLRYGVEERRIFFPGQPPIHTQLAGQTKFLINSENLLENFSFETINIVERAEKIIPNQWNLAIKQGWKVNATVSTTSKAGIEVGRQFCIHVKVEKFQEVGSPSFLRQPIKVQTQNLKRIEAALEICLHNSPPPKLLFGLFADSELTKKLYQKVVSVGSNSKQRSTATISVDLKKDLKGEQEIPSELYVIFQINLPPSADGAIDLIEPCLRVYQENDNFRPLNFYFSTFGDYSKASSRLRGWKLMSCLQNLGHQVSTVFDQNYDVYVYQKVRSFDEVRKLRERNALIIYDFDDNYTLSEQGTQSELIAFMNSVDIVTVGSEFLKDFVAQYHPNVFVLENPADILSDTVKREPSNGLQKIGWFGAPENLLQLNLVNINEPITTVTKGGDIEFDIYTVDEILTQFDLLLFPLEPTEWNLAKNANRMIKAISLGIPVLATATPEHIRVAQELGLDSDFLVDYDGDWNRKLNHLRKNFENAQVKVLQARNQALKIYSIEQIARNWFQHIVNSPKRWFPAKGRVVPLFRGGYSKTINFKSIAILAYNYSATSLDMLKLCETEVNWQDFGRKYLVSAAIKERLSSILEEFQFKLIAPPNDYLEIFQEIQTLLHQIQEDWLLVASCKYVLLKGFYKELQNHLSKEHPEPVALFESHNLATVPTPKPSLAVDLVEALCHPFEPGILLIKTDWLKQNLDSIQPAKLLNYWTWYVLLKALGQGRSCYNHVKNPIAVYSGSNHLDNLSAEYSQWLEPRDQDAGENLPGSETQWRRISHDILTAIASDFPDLLPVVFSQSLIQLEILSSERDKLKRENQAQKQKNKELTKKLSS